LAREKSAVTVTFVPGGFAFDVAVTVAATSSVGKAVRLNFTVGFPLGGDPVGVPTNVLVVFIVTESEPVLAAAFGLTLLMVSTTAPAAANGTVASSDDVAATRARRRNGWDTRIRRSPQADNVAGVG
jgi:hypothetical protein